MSLELIEKHPAVATLTCKDGIECLLKLLASKPEYFPSGDQFEWMTSIFSSKFSIRFIDYVWLLLKH
jgi:hypothetical protein